MLGRRRSPHLGGPGPVSGVW